MDEERALGWRLWVALLLILRRCSARAAPQMRGVSPSPQPSPTERPLRNYQLGPKLPTHSALETLRLRSGRAEYPSPGEGMKVMQRTHRGRGGRNEPPPWEWIHAIGVFAGRSRWGMMIKGGSGWGGYVEDAGGYVGEEEVCGHDHGAA